MPSLKHLLFFCIFCCSALLSYADFDLKDPPQGLFSAQWSKLYLNDEKVGWSHIQMSRDGEEIAATTRTKMVMGRGLIEIEVTSVTETRETLEGAPLEARFEYRVGAFPVITLINIVNNEAVINTTHMGNETNLTLNLPEGTVMSWGSALTTVDLIKKKDEWETAEILTLAPSISAQEVTRLKLENNGLGELEGFGQVLKIGYTVNVMNNDIHGTFYINPQTYTVVVDESIIGGMRVKMVSTTEEDALADFLPPDILGASLVTVKGDFDPDAPSITWRLIKPDNSEKLDLPETPLQSVRKVSDHVYDITVKKGDWLTTKSKSPDLETPGQNYLEANTFLNYDNPKVAELAQRFAQYRDDEAQLAEKLTEFVSDYIVDKSLAVGFSSAAEVAQNASGDCTEHAVLLAALARANGIPSRISAGLVYIEEFQGRQDVMGFHMWTQLYINGAWQDVDAAFEEVETSPRRITLGTSDLKDSTISDLSFSMLDLMGGIQIEIID